ncbi:MAG: hypothetical protein JSS81_14155 [Acidobacteria bacterium]|nr:hypothetical protein [Acidobacteriota bacterium]
MNLLRTRNFIGSLCLLICAVAAHSQTAAELRESARLEREAAAAYKARDYAKFLETIDRAAALRPNHARLLYNLAAAESLNDKPAAALAILERLAAMGLVFAVEKDDDFKSLFAEPRFAAVRDAFARNRTPTGRAARAFAIPPKDLIVEGLAYDGATRRFFAGSIHKRRIVAIDADGRVTDFSRPDDGLWSVSGMRVDEKRRVLWATTTAFPQMENYRKTDEGRSGVFKYDLRTGRLLQKFFVPDAGKHALGDLTIAKNGDVYASDSAAPNIYRIAAGGDALELFLTSDEFASLQGLAFSDDEKTLFAADYSKGVFRIEMRGRKIAPLAVDPNTNAIAIDGLYFDRGNLVAIQNGFRPHRVARFYLDKKLTAIVRSETLEANNPDFDEPTLGVRVGRDFYFVADSQWSLIDDDGRLAEDKLKETVILRLKLQ